MKVRRETFEPHSIGFSAPGTAVPFSNAYSRGPIDVKLGLTRNMERQTAADFIDELDRDSYRFTELVLVVCSIGGTKLISSSDEQRLAKLNAFIVDGGQAIGLLGYAHENRRVRFYARLTQKLANQDWASDLLECLSAKFVEAISERVGVRDFDMASGWVN